MLSCSKNFPLCLFFAESQKLPGQPVLELSIGQARACLRTMGKSGLGACAMVEVEDFFCDR